MAGPTLQSLKALLDNPPNKLQENALSRYSRLVHGLFSACLVNVDEMRYAFKITILCDMFNCIKFQWTSGRDLYDENYEQPSSRGSHPHSRPAIRWIQRGRSGVLLFANISKAIGEAGMPFLFSVRNNHSSSVS